MKRVIVLLILIAGCRGKPDFSPGSDAFLYQGDPARRDVVIVVGEAIVRAAVGTRVRVVGPPPSGTPADEPWLQIEVRDGVHSGVVGSVAARFLGPSR